MYVSVITVALLQVTACGDDQDANLSEGEEYCRRASRIGSRHRTVTGVVEHRTHLPTPRGGGRAQSSGRARSSQRAGGSGAEPGHRAHLTREMERPTAHLGIPHRPARRDRHDVCQGPHLRLRPPGCYLHPRRPLLRVRPGHSSGRGESRCDDMLMTASSRRAPGC